MFEEVLFFVFTIVGWEIGRKLYDVISWEYKVYRGEAAKIKLSTGGTLIVISDKETVSRYVKKYSKV